MSLTLKITAIWALKVPMEKLCRFGHHMPGLKAHIRRLQSHADNHRRHVSGRRLQAQLSPMDLLIMMFETRSCHDMIPISVNVLAHPTSPCPHASAMSPRFRLVQSCWLTGEYALTPERTSRDCFLIRFSKLSLDRHFPHSLARVTLGKNSPLVVMLIKCKYDTSLFGYEDLIADFKQAICRSYVEWDIVRTKVPSYLRRYQARYMGKP